MESSRVAPRATFRIGFADNVRVFKIDDFKFDIYIFFHDKYSFLRAIISQHHISAT